MKILGIRRSPRFSPRSEERDAAIFSAVRRRLEEAGHEVVATGEDEFSAGTLAAPCGPAAVFSMARDEAVLRELEAEERRGLPVISSPARLRREIGRAHV